MLWTVLDGDDEEIKACVRRFTFDFKKIKMLRIFKI